MSAAMRLSVVMLFVGALSSACSRGPSEQSEVPTPTAHLPSRSINDPLTDEDVQTFLSVLDALPGHQAPEFEPLSQVTASERLSAPQLVDVYRREYRAMFDASRHGARWRKSDKLMTTFSHHDVSPEDFAALMIRMSCAITAGTISPQVDLNEVAATADSEIARLVEYIGRIDVAQRTRESIDYRRQALDSLQNFVALSEFTKILQQVPATSRDVVDRHRPQLAGHLPETGHMGQFEQFERTIESQIVPTSFDQQAPSQPSR